MPNLGLIPIAGIIGVGKTTLARGLADVLNAPLICEKYDQNPFLARRFRGDTQAALPCELFFLLGRARQLDREKIQTQDTIICDYLFEKNRIFAALNLNEHQLGIYDELEKAVLAHLAQPRLVIYLYDTIENCLGRIAQRGREYEMAITTEWLGRLSEAYESLLQNWRKCPIMKIDCVEYDLRRADTITRIADQLKKNTTSIIKYE